MNSIDLTWLEIAADFQKDMDLLGWNLPPTFFEAGPQSLENLIRDLLHTHPHQVREICYRLSISEWQLSQILLQKDKAQLANEIAELIMARCKDRIQLRKLFS